MPALTVVTRSSSPANGPTKQQYADAYAKECQSAYPVIDQYEYRLGYFRTDLHLVARMLACPVKVNPPNWQHGRVLYSTLSAYLRRREVLNVPAFMVLDIGTAKGFSAICMQMAIDDAQRYGHVVSVDVINPADKIRRNTVAEVDGLLTLPQTIVASGFGFEAKRIIFLHCSGVAWLRESIGRVHFAFVDGKHSKLAVEEEARLLTERQHAGDIIVFDDVHIPGVAEAIGTLERQRNYAIERIVAIPDKRIYAVATRK